MMECSETDEVCVNECFEKGDAMVSRNSLTISIVFTPPVRNMMKPV